MPRTRSGEKGGMGSSLPVLALRSMGVESFLEVEILGALSSGRRTVAELVQELYGVDRGGSEYSAYYDRVRRGCRSLEGKGLVSRRVFGRDKPYRLTDHGVLTISRARMGQTRERLLGQMDAGLYLVTVLLGLATLSAAQLFPFGDIHFLALYTTFVFLTGASAVRFIELLGRVA